MENDIWNDFDKGHIYSTNKELYQDHILKQYTIFVASTDKVSTRRQQANQFYISLLSGILAILAFTFKENSFQVIDTSFIYLLASSLGLILCYIWAINIRSYRQLNTGKFQVIHNLERKLPFALFDNEWEVLKRGQSKKRYLQLTRVEKFVPLALALPYFLLLIYSLYGLFS